MADTTTTNLGLTKPEVGASADTWGTKLNANLDTIDSKFNASGQALSAVTTTGNAGTATKLATARTISLTGDVTGSASFDGSANASITATIAANSVALGTDTTGNYVADVTAGSYIVKSGVAGEGWSPTVAVDATSANTASKVVARDASGNFSAGTITAVLSGNATTATTLQTARTIQGVSFNGSDNITVVTAGTGVSVAGTAVSIGQAVATSSNVQFNSVGVGTAGSGTAGEIRATNNITAYYSDDRLKTRLGYIENALDKVDSLSGFYYEANEVAQALGYEVKKEVGVSAQQVQAIMPEVVAPAPIDEKYLTVRYERLVPLLIEAIKELRSEVKALKGE